MNKSTVLEKIHNVPTDNSLDKKGENKLYIVKNINNNQEIIYGLKVKFMHFKLRLTILRIAIKSYKNPFDGLIALMKLIKLRRSAKGNRFIKKMVKINGKYYMGLYIPGWNGNSFKSFILSEINKFKKVNTSVNRFNSIFLAITKKCILQCEHCFEWKALNQKEALNIHKLKAIVSKIQKIGVNQIYFTEGEPMLKVDEMITVMDSTKSEIEYWILTSGYNFTLENAQKLKDAGIVGVHISLDHYKPEFHNKFRANENAFKWALEAVKNALACNMVTSLSICITRSFVTYENLMNYMNFAKNLGVSFVQFLEPKAVGHFNGKEVSLLPIQIKLVEKMFLTMNSEKKFKDYPLISYHGYYQRRIGCFSAGLTGIYIDTDGDMNACPFCHKKTGNILGDDFEINLKALTNQGCPSYKKIVY